MRFVFLTIYLLFSFLHMCMFPACCFRQKHMCYKAMGIKHSMRLEHTDENNKLKT